MQFVQRFLFFFIFLMQASVACFAGDDVSVTIHIRGVYSSKITISPLIGTNANLPLVSQDNVMNGGSATLIIPTRYRPGEFSLKMEYRENESGAQYSSERNIIIGKQNLELWAQPMYLNHPDSSYFQPGEKENTAYVQFMQANETRRGALAVLQGFLLKYDQPTSKVYKAALKEYEARRKAYNQWIQQQMKDHASLFVNYIFQFEYIPTMSWKGDDDTRLNSRLDHYFDGISLSDTMILRTREMGDWMNQYVNLFGNKMKKESQRDSIYTYAGRMAIEKSKLGDPKVYGWMVDYFYNGYEKFNMEAGIKMLKPYLDDPNCLTLRRQAINKRLEGMETLLPGTEAPDFFVKNENGKPLSFHNFIGKGKYKLVLFWSADCGHCQQLMKKIYPWYLQDNIQSKLDVIALSLDESETEIEEWNKMVPGLEKFIHRRLEKGINSPEANAYFILATPVMVLVDAKTNKIIALPDSLEKLEEAIQ